MFQGWTAGMYRSTVKDEQIKVNESYRKSKITQQEEVNKKRIQMPMKMSPLSQKEK